MKLAKKVLQVSPAYYPAISIGGPIFTNLTFSKALQDLGCDVEVLATTQGLSESQIAQMNLGKSDQSEFSYPIWRFRYFGYSHFTFSPGLIFWLWKHLSRFDVVVLQAVWNFPIWMAYLMCLVYNKPFIVIPHGSLYPETVGLKSTQIKRLFLWLYVKKMLQRASNVLFSTLDEQEKVLAFLPIKINAAILPNIVDQKPFTPLPERGTWRKQFQISPESPVLVHYGRVNPKKGIPFVLECLPKLCVQFPDLRYVIAGGEDPVYRQALNRIIEEKGVSDQVIFTGLLNQADGIRLLRDADLFLLPSLSENFGMSVVEAMLCETAVIVSDQVGISADLAQANCARVVSTTGDELYEAIADLLGNREQRTQLGLSGAQFVRTYYTEEPVKEQLGRLLQL